jgi:hypothetical protein
VVVGVLVGAALACVMISAAMASAFSHMLI